MKDKIHPSYFPEAKVICACGNVVTVGSTKSELRVEICANCHPLYTGQKKLVDTAGRVERFAKIAAKTKDVQAKRAAQKTAPRKKKSPEVLTERQWRQQVKIG